MEPHVDGGGHRDGASDAGEGAGGVPGGIGECGSRWADGQWDWDAGGWWRAREHRLRGVIGAGQLCSCAGERALARYTSVQFDTV